MLLLKLVLTPALIAVASLAGRRWGHAVSGWLVGLPLTSGPVAFFLAIERGPSFAADAALGSLAGAIAEAAFCLAYAFVAPRMAWPAALAAASVAFTVVAGALQQPPLSLGPIALAAFVSLALTLFVMPNARGHGGARAAGPLGSAGAHGDRHRARAGDHRSGADDRSAMERDARDVSRSTRRSSRSSRIVRPPRRRCRCSAASCGASSASPASS